MMPFIPCAYNHFETSDGEMMGEKEILLLASLHFFPLELLGRSLVSRLRLRAFVALHWLVE